MIVEGICTTSNADGSTNVAALGPVVDEGLTCFALRPFPGSVTYANLRRQGTAVFHVTDDAALIALAALDLLEVPPPLVPLNHGLGDRLSDCCRWFALEVIEWGADPDRPRAECRIVEQGEVRPFWGFNRARHALLETAIIASRLQWLDPAQVRAQLPALSSAVQKTGGQRELDAWQRVERWIQARLPAQPDS